MPRHSLNDRLQQAQSDILSAITQGPSSLDDFQKSWVALQADFEDELRRNGVDDDLSRLAQSTSTIVSTLANSFLRLDSITEERRTRLLSAIDNIAFSRLHQVSEPL